MWHPGKDSHLILKLLLLGPPDGYAPAFILLLIGMSASVWVLAVFSRWVAGIAWKGKARMQNARIELESLLAMALPRLLNISETESCVRPAPGKWSGKEILGHLIDSASNNHQRFVRAQLSSEIRLLDYEQEGWVATQSYQTESWENLVRLWNVYNLHLLHVGTNVPAEKLNNMCFIGGNVPVTLEFIFVDYVRHVKHHLRQILG